MTESRTIASDWQPTFTVNIEDAGYVGVWEPPLEPQIRWHLYRGMVADMEREYNERMDEMGRLEDARIKQREYAKKEYLSGDEATGDEHSAKAEAFLVRILAGEDTETPAEEPTEEPTEEPGAVDEPLSSDPSVAVHQLLARYGHETQTNAAGESIASDPAAVLEATPDNGRELALLGYFGTGPNRYAAADHSLRDQYYTNEGSKPIDPDVNAWADYLASKETA